MKGSKINATLYTRKGFPLWLTDKCFIVIIQYIPEGVQLIKEDKYNLKNAVITILDQLVKSDLYGWPPECIGLLYQPERPLTDCEILSNISSF